MMQKLKISKHIMCNKIAKISILSLLSFVGLCFEAHAQKASMTVENSTVAIAAGTTEMRFSKETYFGPNANWTIDGTLEIWSERVWIAPTAKFSGTGRIVFHNPGDSPYYENSTNSATFVDGNNSAFLDLIVEHANAHRLILENLEDPGYGVASPGASESAQLNIGGSLNLAVDGAHVELNGSNLGFGESAIVENASAKRMVITSNSSEAHVIKHFGHPGIFNFPVGIDAGDYTPARFDAVGKGAVYVSVEDYFVVPFSPKDYKRGMDRIWNVFSPGGAVSGVLDLVNNANTRGLDYQDNRAFIHEADPQKGWSKLKSIRLSEGVHQTMQGVQLGSMASDYDAYFTKLGDRPLFIPNVFTPNGDGTNDTFEIVGIEAFERVGLTIVNRWGNEVYRNENYENNWNGSGLNEGTYYYILTTYDDSKSEVMKGWVLIKKTFGQQK